MRGGSERKHLQEAIDKALGAVYTLEEKMKSLRSEESASF